MPSQAEPPMISDSSSDTSTSDSELASDFDLDPIEEMDEEGDVSELEALLDTAEIAVEASRIEGPVVPAGGKTREKRPRGLVYTGPGNSERTQRYRAAKNAADKKEMEQISKLMVAPQRPRTKYKETKISSFFKPLQPNKSIQEENSEEELEPATRMDFFGTDDSDDSEYHPPNKTV